LAEIPTSAGHPIPVVEAAAQMRGLAWPASTVLDLRLLGALKGIIDLDAEVPHCRLQLGAPEY